MTTETDQVVVLKAGVVVSAVALELAIALETRGITLRLEDGFLLARPKQLITSEDLALLREHRADLQRICTYEAPEL